MKLPPALVLSCLLSCGHGFRARAQQNSVGAVYGKFELVSIKPCQSIPSGGSQVGGSPGRLHLECVTVDDLVRSAYLAFPDGKPWAVRGGITVAPVSFEQLHQQIKGDTGWIQSDRFTIDAKAEGPASSEAMRGPMMQMVLKDRFKLKVHTETRDTPVYYLALAKGGPKFQPSKSGSCALMDPSNGPPPPRAPGRPVPIPFCYSLHLSSKGGLDGALSMEVLCLFFSRGMDRSVIDQTGLSGIFDIHLELTFADLSPKRSGIAPPQPADPGGPALAVDPGTPIPNAAKKIGLQIQPGKKSEDFIVIDHVERPVGN